MVAPICLLPAASLMVVNFQGHVLDLANSANPVIGQTPNPTVTPNQLWRPIPITRSAATFTFVSEVPSIAPLFLSFAEASAGVTPLFRQATGEIPAPSGLPGRTFAIDCVNDTSGFILDTISGLALTAWAQQEGSTATPVTYEEKTGRAEQVWTFKAAETS